MLIFIPMGRVRRLTIQGLLVMAIAFSALLVGPRDTSAGSGLSFCKPEVVHDYTRPFQRLPRVHNPPESGKLPFAPSATVLSQPENPVLVSEDGASPYFSYGFSSYSSQERKLVLNWHILIKLVRVNGRGDPVEVVTELRRRIGTVSDAELGRVFLPFFLPKKEALYRVDLVFRKQNRALLGRYGQYLRVVRPTVAVKLALEREMVEPGQLLQFRVQNQGTTRASYGTPFSVERFDGSKWAVYLGEDELGPWRRILYKVYGGTAGRCQSLTLPADTGPGRYRIRKPLAQPARALTAEFEVALP
jgi:hypothetical protein